MYNLTPLSLLTEEEMETHTFLVEGRTNVLSQHLFQPKILNLGLWATRE